MEVILYACFAIVALGALIKLFYEISLLRVSSLENDLLVRKMFRNNEDHFLAIYKDIQGIEKAIVLLNQKIEAIPNLVMDDLHRTLLAPKEPTKPNNWDSVRQAFKGPVRIDTDVRN